ncbi:phage tail domain-containing protein [Listeria monocytogenes]|uniref:phage tail domain-containing protein n=1 Tax=Listeria monocytogenes TaxID=1639 RepID=UPI003F9933AD
MKQPEKRKWIMLQVGGKDLELTAYKGLHFIEQGFTETNPNPVINQQENQDGDDHIITLYQPFDLVLKCYINTTSFNSVQLAVEELKQLLNRRAAYYVVNSDMPMFKYAVNSCKIEVETIGGASDALLTFTFNCYKGYKESTADTLDSLITDNLYGFGMGLDVNGEPTYTHSSGSFSIYNAGFEIDPRRQHTLKIALTCNAEKSVTITNRTTKDVFTYNKPLKKKQVLLLDGVYPYLDGNICTRDTNRGIIRLANGSNDIQISGASNIDVSFAFYFLYR